MLISHSTKAGRWSCYVVSERRPSGGGVCVVTGVPAAQPRGCKAARHTVVGKMLLCPVRWTDWFRSSRSVWGQFCWQNPHIRMSRVLSGHDKRKCYLSWCRLHKRAADLTRAFLFDLSEMPRSIYNTDFPIIPVTFSNVPGWGQRPAFRQWLCCYNVLPAARQNTHKQGSRVMNTQTNAAKGQFVKVPGTCRAYSLTCD